jgi:hypothetical protein
MRIQMVDVVPSVQTDAQGQFTLTQAPIGVFKLMADGTTAAVTGKKFPTLEFDVTTVAGRDYCFDMVVFYHDAVVAAGGLAYASDQSKWCNCCQ